MPSTTPKPSTPIDSPLQRYLAHRRRYEIGLWIAFIAINFVASTLTAWYDVRRGGHSIEFWEPLSWEASSHLMLLLLLPVFVWLSRRYPLRLFSAPRNMRLFSAPRNIGLNLLASIGVSLIHVVGMVGMRKAIYALHGEHYGSFRWPQEFVYEYLKDFRTYFFFLALIALYRLILLRLQGEASLLAPPDVGAPVESVDRPQRLLVRKLGKEFLIAVGEIEWLEASENYVNLHVRGRIYPLRSTMAAIETRLDPARFIRVHRSHIVNLEHLREIEPLDTGDARLLLSNGERVPCSRRYRGALRTVGAGSAAL